MKNISAMMKSYREQAKNQGNSIPARDFNSYHKDHMKLTPIKESKKATPFHLEMTNKQIVTNVEFQTEFPEKEKRARKPGCCALFCYYPKMLWDGVEFFDYGQVHTPSVGKKAYHSRLACHKLFNFQWIFFLLLVALSVGLFILPEFSKLGQVKSQEIREQPVETYSFKFQDQMNLHATNKFKLQDMVHRARDFYFNNRHQQDYLQREIPHDLNKITDEDYEYLEFAMCKMAYLMLEVVTKKREYVADRNRWMDWEESYRYRFDCEALDFREYFLVLHYYANFSNPEPYGTFTHSLNNSANHDKQERNVSDVFMNRTQTNTTYRLIMQYDRDRLSGQENYFTLYSSLDHGNASKFNSWNFDSHAAWDGFGETNPVEAFTRDDNTSIVFNSPKFRTCDNAHQPLILEMSPNRKVQRQLALDYESKFTSLTDIPVKLSDKIARWFSWEVEVQNFDRTTGEPKWDHGEGDRTKRCSIRMPIMFDFEEQIFENMLFSHVEILMELGGLFAFAYLVFKFLLPFIIFFYLLGMARVVRVEQQVKLYLQKAVALSEIQRIYQNLAFSVRLPDTLKEIKNELADMSVAHYVPLIEEDGVSSSTARQLDLLCDIVLQFKEQRNEALNRHTLIGHLKQQSMTNLEDPSSRPGTDEVTDNGLSPMKTSSSPHPYKDGLSKTQGLNTLELMNGGKRGHKRNGVSRKKSLDIEENKTLDYDDANSQEAIPPPQIQSGPLLNTEDDVWAYLFLAEGSHVQEDFEATKQFKPPPAPEQNVSIAPVNEPELVKDQLVRAVQIKRLDKLESEIFELHERTKELEDMSTVQLVSLIRERVSFFGIFMLYEKVRLMMTKLDRLDALEDTVNKLKAENQYLKYKVRHGNSLSEFFSSIDASNSSFSSMTKSKKFGMVKRGGVSDALRKKKQS